MSEVNQNSPSFDSDSMWINQSDSTDYWSQDSREQQNQVTAKVSTSASQNESSLSKPSANSRESLIKTNSQPENSTSLEQKMNWQRIAHKLREYNRKLLKKVFRLEQELAEIDNKFTKYVEKSQNSDLLLAHQAEEIKSYQEKFDLLTQQLANSQQQIDDQEVIIKQVAEEQESSQKQAAQLERECTLLQEKYNNQAFELVAKEQQNQALQTQLSEQQQNTLDLEAKLNQYQAAEISRKEKATHRHQNYPHNRYIQPWSTSTIPEPKIPLPRNQPQPTAARQKDFMTSETVKTAAKIATWSATTISKKKADQSPITSTTDKSSKSSASKKPKSLAAVDLPTFPRPQ